MTTPKQIVKLKAEVARAAGTVAHKEIELRLAKDRHKKAVDALEAEIDKKPIDKKPAKALYIVNAGLNKIQVIKAIREFTMLGLKEAKDIVDAASLAMTDANRVDFFGDPAEAERAIAAAGGKTRVAYRSPNSTSPPPTLALRVPPALPPGQAVILAGHAISLMRMASIRARISSLRRMECQFSGNAINGPMHAANAAINALGCTPMK